MKLRDVPFPIDGMAIKHVMFVIEYLKTRKATQAAEAVGMNPDEGHRLLQRPDVQTAVSIALERAYTEAKIDAAWVLQELVDNHYLARQMGNLPASNQALNTIAKHAQVDAFAAEKIELAGDEEIRARLARARKRRVEVSDGQEQEGPDFR